MTTTEELVDKLTVDQLAADDVFVALCNTWQSECHCPLVMPDYLRECGCDRAAMVATWAVNHMSEYVDHISEYVGRLFPSHRYFVRLNVFVYKRYCYGLPEHNRVDGLGYNRFDSFDWCIADFLLNADPVALFTLAPPKAEYSII